MGSNQLCIWIITHAISCKTLFFLSATPLCWGVLRAKNSCLILLNSQKRSTSTLSNSLPLSLLILTIGWAIYTCICWHLRSKKRKQYQFKKKKWFFRVKVLTFRFGCSQTLNSKCWRQPSSCGKSRQPTIFRPMTQSCSWYTSGRKKRRV